ncbi:hypothetical protein JHK87_047204 [Glycine soja]|nr:hypothetical protein JHK87_047204 [Glycine soja]
MLKFKGHYKQVVSLKKSGCTNNDVIFHAYDIWKEDEGNNFGLEQAWRLLKDQPKWFDQFTKNCSKRTNISTFGTYSSSSNLKTPIVDFEADTLSPIEAMRERNVLNTKLAVFREKKVETGYYDIIMKGTSTMSESQLQNHQTFCKIIRPN